MSKIISRASVVSAGLATVAAAFVGLASAAPSLPIDNSNGDSSSPLGGTSQDSGSMPSTSGLDNGLTSVDMPKIGGVSYVTRHHDDDFEGWCDALNGKSDLPGRGGSFNHKCQSKDNSFMHGKAEIAGIDL